MTIRECVEYLAPGKWRRALSWPPDAFALCAYLLQKSGAYLNVVSQWPPASFGKSQADWVRTIRRMGAEWRKGLGEAKPRKAGQAVPEEIGECWKNLIRSARLDLGSIAGESRARGGRLLVWESLACICAAADEACRGIGLPGGYDALDAQVSEFFMMQMLADERITTLCRDVDASKVCILPKLHTPRTGITVRSLSHNLSFLESGEVRPVWSPAALLGMKQIGTRLNLLLVPWPASILPMHFSETPRAQCGLANMPERFGFFDYEIRGGSSSWPKAQFKRILHSAAGALGRIDGVVLPELAVRDEEADDVYSQIAEQLPQAFLITGIGGAGKDGGFGTNGVRTVLPLSQRSSAPVVFKSDQGKHHRWLLTGAQARQYGISGRLSPEKDWWENTRLDQRQILFHSLAPNLTLCSLVCEDLARQDPIANLIRGVGPDLVIALLLDGPQLNNRWPARYATVLADDPGSSVLTLTSLGMARLCRPLGVRESRVIGLWKDARSGPFEIEMPYDAEAVVISIEQKDVEEWTADGRSDDGVASHWVLNGVFPIRLNED